MCSNCKSHEHKDNNGHNHDHNGVHCHCEAHSHSHSHEHSHEPGTGDKSWFRKFGAELISGLMLIAGVIASHYSLFDAIGGNVSELIWFILTVLPVGWPIVREMFESWGSGSVMNEFTLMVAAAVGAFVIGEYPEAVAVLLFYSFGEKLEDRASDNVRDRIKSLIGHLPDAATLVDGDSTRSVDPHSLQPGDILLVRPGERVPADATLLGDSPIEFDTAAITGESVPRSYAPGDELPSGIIPTDRAVKARVLHLFNDSSMSRILKMIEDAENSKAPTETMLRRITRYYTPIVFALAVALFCIPWIVSLIQGVPFAWEMWLRRSLVFLVCSCPCALVVSIPLSYFAAIGRASRLGILFKGSAYIDSLRRVSTVFFDKTGTLTTGEFHVSSICATSGNSADSLLAIAAAIDSESTHPLAKAICADAARRKIALPSASDVKTIVHGMTGTIDGKSVIVGSRSLMTDNNVALPPEGGNGSEICVAVDGVYIGSIFLADTVKSDVASAIVALHKAGVKDVEILSGDREQAVADVAKRIGADGFHASLLPADKQRILDEAKGAGNCVAFVGDGINDAPAIALADVGVSMGTTGTDMAMESSDMVIVGDDIAKLPQAIRLSRRVRSVVIENVTFALGVKATVMILGAFGIATLWAAVFADTGVTLITILWTLLRLMRR